jgi:hypothetical protein
MAGTRDPLTSQRQPPGLDAGHRRNPPGPLHRSPPQAGAHLQASASGPVVVLTYNFAGARRLQSILERAPELACTTGVGIIGMCDMAARAWMSVEGSDGEHLSSLAAKSLRAMVSSMMTIIVVRSGARRWCETAVAEPAAAEVFLRVIPNAQFICLHRSCPDVVRTVLRTSPWGIIGGPFAPYLAQQPTNVTAAIAACWVDSVSSLLEFESRHPESCLRVRYEDLVRDPDSTSAAVFDFIGATPESTVQELADEEELLDRATKGGTGPKTEFPVGKIPPQLIQRVNQFHEKLDYPQLS